MKSDTTRERYSCQSRKTVRGSRFLRYSDYLKAKYNATAYRVAVDAGFSCPNRGSDRANEGCTYCDEFGARATYSRASMKRTSPDSTPEVDMSLSDSIRDQINRGVDFLSSRYNADVFLLYFQAFSSTYGDLDLLRSVYDCGLEAGAFRELIVATRPDCVDEKIAELLGSYITPDRDVWVELGLQSACDKTLARIRRGHTVAEFERAFHTLRNAGVKLACHLILGLPEESESVMMDSVDYVAELRPEAVKLHDLHVPSGTELHRDYLRGELSVATGERYLGYLASAVERLPEDTVLMRICCDTPVDRRTAPRYVLPKSALYQALDAELARRSSCQGTRFSG